MVARLYQMVARVLLKHIIILLACFRYKNADRYKNTNIYIQLILNNYLYIISYNTKY